MPIWKLDLPRPPDAPKRFHYEWCQRALKELFTANQMSQSTYHEALIELSRLRRDVVDDPDVAAICNAEAETYALQGASTWGSADSAAWGRGGDTRSTRSAVIDLWAPHPGPAPAEGQPVSVVVAKGVAPGLGSSHPLRSRDAQDARDRQKLLDDEYERREAREKAEYIRERDAARRNRRSHPDKWSQSNNWAHAHAQRNSSACDPRAQTSHSRSGGKRSHATVISSDEEGDSIRSHSASEQGYTSNQPSSSRKKQSQRQPRFDAKNTKLARMDQLRNADSMWDEAELWHEAEKRRPMLGPNFSNDPPPTFTPSETNAKEALYAERAKARA